MWFLRHGISRPQVADGGKASHKAGTCEDVYYVLEDSRQSDVPQLGFGRVCYCTSYNFTKHSQFPLTWTETYVQSE